MAVAAMAVPAVQAEKPGLNDISKAEAKEAEAKAEAKEAKKEEKEAPASERPKIEVCFVLDTTGSMSGLIQAAKDKIWSIANELVSAKPAPEIKFGLIGYRDRGDDYITKVTDLTDDIDDIYGKLMAFSAAGGGDGPESVNQALNEAVTKMSWNEDKDVLKIIFLVGDAPPHTDYKDDVQYGDSCKEAMKKDLIINAIQCGSDGATAKIWKEIAGLSEGQYVAIKQSGGAVAMATPFDDEIAALNSDLAGTVVAYGDERARRFAGGKVALARDSAPEAAAARLDYLKKSKEAAVDAFAADPASASGPVPTARPGSASVIAGGGDLIEQLADGSLGFEDIEDEKLPEELKELNEEERTKYVEKRIEDRKVAQEKLNEALKKRADFITAEKEKLKKEGKGDSFDLKVEEIIRTQAAEKGISYDKK